MYKLCFPEVLTCHLLRAKLTTSCTSYFVPDCQLMPSCFRIGNMSRIASQSKWSFCFTSGLLKGLLLFFHSLSPV